MREAIDAWLPDDLERWMAAADEERERWNAKACRCITGGPKLLDTLNRLYDRDSRPG